MTRLIWTMIAVALLMFVAPVIARSEELPKGLGHPTDGSHWYDRTCCDNRDCEEVEPGAITRTSNGVMIKYRSARGHVAEGFLPWGAPGIRPSKDGREHACSFPSGRVPCAYLPAEI